MARAGPQPATHVNNSGTFSILNAVTFFARARSTTAHTQRGLGHEYRRSPTVRS